MRPGTIRKTLSTLPSTLDETYERILLNIDEQYKQEALAALTWLVASQRVLTVKELAEAVSIETDSEDPFDPSNRLFEPNTICNVLSGLISLVQNKIRLAHFSVEEYLVSDRIAKSRASHFYIPFRFSHIRLADASLIYLQWAKIFLTEEFKCPMSDFYDNAKFDRPFGGPKIVTDDRFLGILQEKAPLLAYACNFWYLHVRMCKGYVPEREIRLVKDFLTCHERISFFEIGTYWTSDDDADNGCHSSRHALMKKYRPSYRETRAKLNFAASPLYHAARLGLVDIVTSLLEDTDRCHMSLQSLASSQPMHQKSTSGTFGDELRIACFYGQKEIVEILVNAGADVEAVGGAFKTAMGACMHSESPNPDIIQILVESVERIPPDFEWIFGWVLRWAAIEGHLPIVNTVMSKVDCVGPQKFTWTQDYLRLLRLGEGGLHSHNVRKDIEGSESYPRHGTAPYEAASAGHYEILSLLISNWSDVDEEDYEGRTALYWAAFNGHTETVKLLLHNGARTNGHRVIREWTPAYWAWIRGFHEIEELLVHTDRANFFDTHKAAEVTSEHGS